MNTRFFQAAFKYVVENDLRMKLTCWFLQKYAGENPDEEHEQRRIPWRVFFFITLILFAKFCRYLIL